MEDKAKNPVIKLTWECGECGDVKVSYSNRRHDMNYCGCGKSAVDLEEYYQRSMGVVKSISREIQKPNGDWEKLNK